MIKPTLKTYEISNGQFIKTNDARPLIDSKVYRLTTFLFAGISALASGYFISFLAKLAGVPFPYHLIAGGIIAFGLTITYISKEFDNAISELSNGRRPLLEKLNENKIIYFVRFTTVMGICMLLYSGIDFNQRQLENQDKAAALFMKELQRKQIQENNLLAQNIVSATDSTVSRQISKTLKTLSGMYLSQATTDHTAFLKYLAQLTPLSYSFLVLFFVASLGLGLDLAVSILTRKCAQIAYSATLLLGAGPQEKEKKSKQEEAKSVSPQINGTLQNNKREQVFKILRTHADQPLMRQVALSGVSYHTYKKYEAEYYQLRVN